MIEGSMREKSPGHWELRLRLGRDPATGKLRRVSKTFHGSQAQAKKALRELCEELAERDPGSSLKVGELLDSHLTLLRRERKSPNTLREYRRRVDTILKPALGATPLDKLTVRQIDALYEAEQARGQSAASVRQTHAILSGALSRARDKGWLPDDRRTVAQKATIPDKPVSMVPAPTTPEVQALNRAAKATEAPERALFVEVVSATGLRLGEVCGLRWSDLVGRSLLVTRAIAPCEPDEPDAVKPSSDRANTKKAGHWVVPRPLKKHRPRQIALDEATVRALTHHHDNMEARAELCEMTLAPDAYIFSNDPDQARPWYPPNMSTTTSRIQKAAGLTRVGLHSLRHHAATEMNAHGVDPVTGATRLGQNVNTYHGDYASSRPARDQAAADLLGSLLRSDDRTEVP